MTDSTRTRSARDTGSEDPVVTSAPADTAAAATDTAATTVAAATYPVVADVNIRSGPGTSYSKVGVAPVGSRVSVLCQTHGQTIVGPLGTSDLWDRIGSGRYVSDTYVNTGSDGFVAPQC